MAAANVDLIDEMTLPLLRAGERMEEIGQERPAAILLLLSVATAFWLDLDTPKESLRSPGHVGSIKFIGPEDLTNDHLDMLTAVLPYLTNDELRARVADLLWQQRAKRVLPDVKIAIAAYLARAKALETSHSWPRPFSRLRRALQLALAIGPSNPESSQVETYAIDLMTRLGDAHTSFFVEAIGNLLLDTDRTATEMLAIALQAQHIAQSADTSGEFLRARRYYLLASKWYLKLGQTAETLRMNLAAGETYVAEALTREPMVQAILLSQAVVALRNAKAPEERLAEVRRMQASAAKKGSAQMTTVATGVDLSDIIVKSQEKARGLSAQDGLLRLARLHPIPSKERLQNTIHKQMTQTPLRFAIGTRHVDEEGRVLGVRGPALSKDPEAANVAFELEMMHQATYEWQLIVHGVILPFVDVFTLENRVGFGELVQFVNDRPFVPIGRELLFARGLHAGFQGDFATAAALLIPQLEHSLRNLLMQAGEFPYKHDAIGVQDFWDLNRILEEPKLEELLGKDEVFDLRALLVSRSGANFRNGVAHGLLGLDGMKGFVSTYFWWRTIYLIANVVAEVQE